MLCKMCYHVVAGRVLGSELTFSPSSYFLLLLRVQPPLPLSTFFVVSWALRHLFTCLVFPFSTPTLVSTFRPWLFWFEHSSFIRSSNHMIHEHLETDIIFSLPPLRNNVTPQILLPPTFLHFFSLATSHLYFGLYCPHPLLPLCDFILLSFLPSEHIPCNTLVTH